MKLIDKVRREIRRRNYSYSTEKHYCRWIIRFIRFHNLIHPENLKEKDIVKFLNHLALSQNVAASTQNQALCAIVFLYKDVLKSPVGDLDNLRRAKKPKHLPTVLSKNEVAAVLQQMDGIPHLVCSLLYGSGLRISEALRLRVKDIDFDYRQIIVRCGKGNKDRVTMLPEKLEEVLKHQIKKVKNLHQQDLLGHKSLKTTSVYLHVLNRGGHGVKSPLDQ